MEALLPIELELMTLHIATWWDFLWMNPNAINYCNLMSWMNFNWKPTNPLKLHKFNKKKFLTRRWKNGSSKKMTLSWCLMFNIIVGFTRNYCPNYLDILSSKNVCK
jgi:hypothetical protein